MNEETLPPHDLFTERCALFACMANNVSFEIAMAMLRPDDFYLPAHNVLFGMMIGIGSADLAELRNAARATPQASIFNDTINDLFESGSSCSPARIESYCQMILNLSAQRHAKIEGQRLVEAAHNDTPDELASRLNRVADEVRDKSPQMCADPVKDLYDELTDAVEGRRYSAPMPWDMIAKATRALLPGTVTILCGSPGATKSLAAVQLLRYLREKLISCCLLALEDGVPYHLRRAAAQILALSDLTDDDWCRANPEKVVEIKTQLGSQLEELRRAIQAPKATDSCTPEVLLAWVRQVAQSHRVIIIDPITLMVYGSHSWEDDKRFLIGAKRIIEATGSSLLLITHPRKMPHGSIGKMSMDDLAGGVAYSRFSQTVLMLAAHDEREHFVERMNGGARERYNRTLTVFKARNGRGAEGHGFALTFDSKSLTLKELGRIRKEQD